MAPAHKAIAGSPSPLAQEVTAIAPRIAVVMYGTNHIGYDNIWQYGESMLSITDQLIGWGVIPVLTTIPPRADSASANLQVPRYNAVVRGVGQARQVPVIDLHRELLPLPQQGLGSDGIHLNVKSSGCDLTSAGLQYGFNVRNRLTLEALARVKAALDSAPAPDPATAPLQGGWFHSGGIFASLSPGTAALIVEGMQAAKAAGAVTSFELNYREKLWKTSGGSTGAVRVLRSIVDHVDVLVGNEEDLQMGLGIPGPEVAAKSKLDPSAFIGMIGKVVKKHPQIKSVATTLREVHSTNRHSWGAVAWINGKTYHAPTCELDVVDRVGGGDGYAAGLFYGLLSGASEQEAVNLGWAHGAL